MKKFLTAALMLAACIPALPVWAADPIGSGPYAAPVDSICANTSILASITSRFDDRARRYLEQPIAIAQIGEVRPGRVIPRSEMQLVGREYCEARVYTTDGVKRPLWYLIERPWGFAGVGKSVEFCVSGLDPWFVYGADCASLK